MSQNFLAQAQENRSIEETEIRYHTVNVDQCKAFYRGAGSRGAPTLLLLQGFPTASLILRGLIPLLGDQFQMVAPDLPGFGLSVVSLCAEIPRLLLSISETSFSWKQLENYPFFTVYILRADHQTVADQFAGSGGLHPLLYRHGAYQKQSTQQE